MLGAPPVAYITPSAEISPPVRQRRGDPAPALLDPRDLGPRMRMSMPRARISSAERDADVVVEAVEQLLAADQLDDLGAEPVEDAGELDRDVAAADDDDAPRQRRQIERLVRGDGVLDAGHVRHRRVAAGGDQDVLGGVRACRRPRRCAGSTSRPRPSNSLTPRIASRLHVDAVEAVDLAVLGGDQLRPVEGSARCTVQPKPAASSKASAKCAP